MPYQFAKSVEARQRGINAGFRSPDKKVHPRNRRLSSTSYYALAILIQFSDKPANVNAGYFDTLLFSNADYTLRRYYQEISYGQMDIITVNLPSSLGWTNIPQTYDYYVAGQNGFGIYPRNAQKMVEDAIMSVDSLIDFSRYDNDGDGYVDALFIVHAGPGAEFTGSPNDVWSHQWTTYSPVMLDGVNIYSYSTEPEYWISSGDMTCGVYAHEMGHAVFGLPDLYDYGNDSRGLGRWSLMASGSWNGYLGNSPAHPDPWSRLQMGFISPSVIVDDMTDVTIAAVETANMVLKYIPPVSNGKEYFLFENRQKIGFDKQLRGERLLIYHVDETRFDNNNQWYPGSDSSYHYMVALEQADGRWDLERNQNAGDASDPFPGSSVNTVFTPASVPRSECYSGETSVLSLENIRGVYDIIQTSIYVHPPSPRIASDHSALDIALVVNDSSNQNILVQNTGLATLRFQIRCDSLPAWVNLFPDSGHIVPGGNEAVSIQLSTFDLQPGQYQTSLHSETNDSTHRIVDVALSLLVTEIGQQPRFTFMWDYGWNILSNPVRIPDNTLSQILSSSISEAYWYNPDSGENRYEVHPQPLSGKGYWMKFDANKNVQVSDYLLDSLTIDVHPGWNLIGTISTPLPVQQVITIPPDNLCSYFFKFKDGYCRADTLFPGRGYWIHVKEEGRLILKPGQSGAAASAIPIQSEGGGNLGVLAFRDALNKTQELYLRSTVNAPNEAAWNDLPPLPPQDIFDIRFAPSSNNTSGTEVRYTHLLNGQQEEFPILISSVSYPLTITWTGDVTTQHRYTLIEMINGVPGNMRDLRDGETIVLNNPQITSLVLRVEPSPVVPDEFYLEQNYPNPFNPSTTVRFSLPTDAVVTLTVYNEIGQEVAILLNQENIEWGMHEIGFVAMEIPSGIYFYRLIAEGKTERSVEQPKLKFISTRKMLVLK